MCLDSCFKDAHSRLENAVKMPSDCDKISLYGLLLRAFLDAVMARAHQVASGWLMLSRLVAFAS